MVKNIFVFAVLLAACKTIEMKKGAHAPIAAGEDILFFVDDDSISVEEFSYVYQKNNINNDSAYTRQDIKEYLDLFINFKLKIAEAKSRGADTTIAFKNELNGYLDQLKQPYLSENSVTEKLIEQAYNRYKDEIRASHILIEIDEKDTLKAYNEAMELRKQIIDGASFEAVAKEKSIDPSVKTNSGDLGYFTSFQMVYPFESAAYAVAPGELSMPVRTQFGYHIINVKERRPSHGKVQVAHIMLKHESDSNKVRNRIFDIYEQAVGGVAWAELVNQYSEDVNSKRNNGILRAFSVGQMPLQFQEAAFSLQVEGEISDPVKTQYGWHILKFIKREPIPSLEEMRPTISARIGKDERSQLSNKVLIKRLKEENGFSENAEMYKMLNALADSTLILGLWNPDIAPFEFDTLFNVGNIAYTVSDFVDYVKRIQKTSTYDAKKYMDTLYENYKNKEIIAYEEAHLEEKYIDYKMLLKEYKEGILLFDLMEKEVWNKAVTDSLGLQAFYENNKKDYRWGERADVMIFSAENTAILASIKERIISKDTTLNKQSLYKKFNTDGDFALEIKEGLFEKGAVKVLDQCPWVIGVYEKVYAGKKHLIWVKRIMPSREKKLNEARGAVISDYQGRLEENWIKTLKQKFEVTLNTNVLDNVYDALEKK